MASTSVADVEAEDGALMAIGVETIRASYMLPFDLYIYGETSPRPVLFRQKELPVAADDLRRLLDGSRRLRGAVPRPALPPGIAMKRRFGLSRPPVGTSF
jgi:hypothetical protein